LIKLIAPLLLLFFIDSANAQHQNPPPGIIQSNHDLGQVLNGLQLEPLGGTRSGMESLNQLSNLMTGFQSVNEGVGGYLTESQFSELLQFLNQALSSLTGTFGGSVRDGLLQYSRTNDVLEKLVDPKHMFLVSAATASGAIIGATVTRELIELISGGVREVYLRISGIHHREEVRKNSELFQKARQAYEKVRENQDALENSFDGVLGLLKLYQNPDYRKYFSSSPLNPLIEQFKAHYEIVHEDLKTAIRSQSPRIDEIQKVAASIQAGLETLNLLSRTSRDFSGMCSNVEVAYQKANEIDGYLQQIRLKMLAHENEWRESVYDSFIEEQTEDAARITKPSTIRMGAKLDRRSIRKIDRMSSVRLSRMATDFLSKCRQWVKDNGLSPKQGSIRKTCTRILNAEPGSVVFDFFETVSNQARQDYSDRKLPDQSIEMRTQRAGDRRDLQDLRHLAYGHQARLLESEHDLFTHVGAIRNQMEGMLSFLDSIREEQLSFSSTRLKGTYEKIMTFCQDTQK
jgi:hypothetical protein